MPRLFSSVTKTLSLKKMNFALNYWKSLTLKWPGTTDIIRSTAIRLLEELVGCSDSEDLGMKE